MIREGETYIGDGVYASFDGYQVWLRTPRETGDHSIALEPSVMRELLRYVETNWPGVIRRILREQNNGDR